MARNSEKNFAELNRLYLHAEKESELLAMFFLYSSTQSMVRTGEKELYTAGIGLTRFMVL